ncbi:ABC transporter ATP-binding protein [Candidatus Parcubacteria bacterium]|nr:MAG: ABC transporter ATP-binding protein [Candidatus Parcubacteria bacterium]
MGLIEVKNLQKTYYNDDVATPALDGVSFSIDKGNFVAIMGPSGSGKSTLLHILGFLDKPTGGEYKFNGKNSNDYSEEEIAVVRNEKIGFVFQSFNLLPKTTVLDNVMLPLLYSKFPGKTWKQKAISAIDAVGLSHRINHLSSQLSGGEKQRVAIARALINNPQVIFADEPTGNLDSKSGKAIMEILQELNIRGGHTIILITHETYTAEHAEKIIQLLDGKISKIIDVPKRHSAKDNFVK